MIKRIGKEQVKKKRRETIAKGVRVGRINSGNEDGLFLRMK